MSFIFHVEVDLNFHNCGNPRDAKSLSRIEFEWKILENGQELQKDLERITKKQLLINPQQIFKDSSKNHHSTAAISWTSHLVHISVPRKEWHNFRIKEIINLSTDSGIYRHRGSWTRTDTPLQSPRTSSPRRCPAKTNPPFIICSNNNNNNSNNSFKYESRKNVFKESRTLENWRI